MFNILPTRTTLDHCGSASASIISRQAATPPKNIAAPPKHGSYYRLLRGKGTNQGIKQLSTALNMLHQEKLDAIRTRFEDATQVILTKIQEVAYNANGPQGWTEASFPPAVDVDIPSLLADRFALLAAEKYPANHATGWTTSTTGYNIPLVAGVDAAVAHFKNATESSTADNMPSTRPWLTTVLSLLKAVWILRETRKGTEFVNSSKYQGADSFERQIIGWGMTIDRFIRKLEEVSHLP